MTWRSRCSVRNSASSASTSRVMSKNAIAMNRMTPSSSAMGFPVART
jgi:hypothetical protein